MKKTEDTKWSMEHVLEIELLVRKKLNDFEVTQLTTLLIESGNISEAGIKAIK